MLNKIKFWYINSRPHALPQSVLPAVLALCMASQTEDFMWWLGILAIVGVASAHLSFNLFDDYFDFKAKKSTYREDMQHKGIRARIHKCPYLTSGQTTMNSLLTACLMLGGIAITIGIVILCFRGLPVLYIAVTAAILGVEYSGYPLRLSYRGLGELVIFLLFGILNMIGVYYAACGQLDWSVVFISIPVGLLVMNIVFVHSIIDSEADREARKMTFARLLSKKRRMIIGLLGVLSISYGSIIVGVIIGTLSVCYLFVLLTLPMAIALFYLIKEILYYPQNQHLPKKWYGPMGNFKKFQDINVDWFMLRWLLARNLLTLFCVIIIVVVFVKG